MVLDEAWNRTTQLSGHAGVLPVHVTAFILAVANFLLNSFICLAFHRNRRLFHKCRLYIFFAFAFTNCLSGFFSQPTLINLFIHNNLNCPRWTIMIGSVFEIALDRIRKILTISIAVERVYAVFMPSHYYVMDHYKFSLHFCILGITWGTADAVAMSAEDNIFEVRVHCVTTASSGSYFHAYFLISSIAMGTVLLIAYSLFIIKLTMMTESLTSCRSDIRAQVLRENNRQANSLSAVVVLCVILFSVVPSALYFYDFLKNEIIFMEAGPVITIGYHLYGCISFFIYNWQHREIRRAIIKTARSIKICPHEEPMSFKTTIVIPNKTANRRRRQSRILLRFYRQVCWKRKRNSFNQESVVSLETYVIIEDADISEESASVFGLDR